MSQHAVGRPFHERDFDDNYRIHRVDFAPHVVGDVPYGVVAGARDFELSEFGFEFDEDLVAKPGANLPSVEQYTVVPVAQTQAPECRGAFALPGKPSDNNEFLLATHLEFAPQGASPGDVGALEVFGDETF